MKKEVTHFMDPGHWFLSLYNDDGDPQEVSFVAVISEDMTQNCPNGCSGKGECLLGHCQCNAGFGGDDCSESMFQNVYLLDTTLIMQRMKFHSLWFGYITIFWYKRTKYRGQVARKCKVYELMTSSLEDLCPSNEC